LAVCPLEIDWALDPETTTVKSNGACPVPLSATVAEVAVEADAMLNVPVEVPPAVGVKATPTAQFAPAAKVSPVHVSCVRLNGDTTVSVSEAAEKLPVLVTVTVCAALGWPMTVDGKVNFDGLTLSTVRFAPLPLSGTLKAATPSVEEEIVSVAALAPVVAGVKITCTVQLLPLASAAPQLVIPVEKLLAARPVIWKPTLAIEAPPVLLTVSVMGGLATPAGCPVKLKLVGLALNTAGCNPVPFSATV
jgi:hypothetical protein